MPLSMPTVSMSMPTPVAMIDGRILPDIIDAYFAAKTIDLDGVTKTNYRLQLRPWRAFWDTCASAYDYMLSPTLFSAAHTWIKNEYRNTHGNPPHPTTVFDCFTRIKSVLHWAFRNNCTGTVNLAEWCPRLRRGDPDLYFPTPDELGRMLAMPSDECRLRDVALMAWLTSTGARLFETANVLAGEIVFNTPITNMTVGRDHAGYAHLRFVKGDNQGERGGRHVAFGNEAGLLLKCYLRSVPRRADETVFGLSDKGIGLVVRRHAEMAGLPEISPHAFRRLFTDYWDEYHRMDYRAVLKKQLGHKLDKADITEGHYLNGKNKRRIIAALQEHHVSPLAMLGIDWTQFPVNIEAEINSMPL